MVKIPIMKKILQDNDSIATHLRKAFNTQGLFTCNLISSPGAGKTTLLEETIRHIGETYRCGVLVGDVATRRDAERLEALGVPSYQILTGGACHLDARMVMAALPKISHETLEALFIENVGNLICPTSYDLGEEVKIALLSIPEGEDKPFKYPGIFSKAGVTVITKIDLLPYLPFEMDAVTEQIKTLNPSTLLFPLSSRTGEGFDDWITWLTHRIERKKSGANGSA